MKDLGERASIYQNGTYLENNPHWCSDDSPFKARHVLRMLDKHQLTPRAVCDVGCGAGLVLKEMAKTLPESRLVGVDVSPQALAMAKAGDTRGVEFLQTSLPPENESYDLVMALDVFEHVENPFDFLRTLRPRGTYKIFHIPIEIFGLNLLRPNVLRQAWDGNGHLHFYTKEIALRLLEHCAYEVIDFTYTPGSLETPQRTVRAKAANVVRGALFERFPELVARTLGGFPLLVLAR